MRDLLLSPHGLRTTCISFVAFVSPYGLKNDECYMYNALVSPHGLKNDVYFIEARLSRLMAERYYYFVSRELTYGESDRLLPGQTVSIGSDRVCLPTSSIPLAPVNLLLPVPLIKPLAFISGSGGNRTQSAHW